MTWTDPTGRGRSREQAARDMQLVRLGARITDLRPEIGGRWLLPSERAEPVIEPETKLETGL